MILKNMFLHRNLYRIPTSNYIIFVSEYKFFLQGSTFCKQNCRCVLQRIFEVFTIWYQKWRELMRFHISLAKQTIHNTWHLEYTLCPCVCPFGTVRPWTNHNWQTWNITRYYALFLFLTVGLFLKITWII